MGKSSQAVATEWDDIEEGNLVRHPKWGEGSVLHRTGSGETAKAVVVFPEEGMKKLMLKYAKLKRIKAGTKADAARAKAAKLEAMGDARAVEVPNSVARASLDKTDAD